MSGEPDNLVPRNLRRIDRVEQRLDRIERCLDLIDTPPGVRE